MGELVVVAGMSGAGRSTAAATFEDAGWFVVDNLPPELAGRVVDLVARPGGSERIALVVGRAGTELGGLDEAITDLRHSGTPVRVLYLDAADDVLVRRYEGTRRRHPIEGEGVEGAIAVERALLAPVRRLADVVVDTTDLNVHQLRERILDIFSEGHASASPLRIAVVSFGYSHGLPRDADLVLDCRFLPNPHWIPELRPHTGLDVDVRDYVLGQPAAKEFLTKVDDLLELLLPAYVAEGKAYLTIAVGCTGGRHRSVAIANELHRRIEDRNYIANIAHRDVQK
ncbi:MAG: RNase adapter protein RapZ [Actinomycetota bacterium]